MIDIIRRDEHYRREEKLARIASRAVVFDAELLATVSAIIEDVRARGDAALIDYSERFDGVRPAAEDLRLDEAALRGIEVDDDEKVWRLAGLVARPEVERGRRLSMAAVTVLIALGVVPLAVVVGRDFSRGDSR